MAQYFQFSQYNFTDQRVNPAAFSASKYASAKLIYRNQRAADNFNLNSTFLSASYPVRRTKGPTSAFGFSLLDDRAGDAGIFRTNILGITYGVSVPVKRDQAFSLGIKAGWQNRRVSFDGLFTGSQFVPGRGFTGASSGERIEQFRESFFTWSAGLLWARKQQNGEQTAHFGISLFDLNRPDESFYSADARLPTSFVLSLGGLVKTNSLWSVYPELLLTYSSSLAALNLGMVTRYPLRMQGPVEGGLNIITKYVTTGYAIAGVQLEGSRLVIGLSYDMPVTSQVANTGSWEVGLALRQLVKASAPKRRVRRSKYAKRRLKNKVRVGTKHRKRAQTGNDRQGTSHKKGSAATTSIGIVKKPAKHDSLEVAGTGDHSQEATTKGEAIAGQMKRHPMVMEDITFTFNFPFNQSTLQEVDKQALDDLVKLLLEDPRLKVEIVGHTDDVGSADFNKDLSISRASSVSSYLIQMGINPSRVKVEGRGEKDPLVENNSAGNRAINRRVEFVISY